MLDGIRSIEKDANIMIVAATHNVRIGTFPRNSGYVQETVLHQVVNCTSTGAIDSELSSPCSLEPQCLMVPSNKLQTSIRVRGNSEPVSLSIVIDHGKNHRFAMLNRDDRPGPAL